MAEQLLRLGHPGFRERHRLVLFVDEIIAGRLELLTIFGLDVALGDGTLLELRNDPVDLVIEIGRLLSGTRDNERRSRLVDQNAVHLVHDGEVVRALHHRGELELHVVAKVVETELVIGAVGDVGGIGDLPLGIGQLVLDHADGHAEEPVHAAHPLGVAARQIVVDGDHVHALAGQRVEIRGQRGHERLALAGFHLGNPPAVQDDAADQLDVKVPHVQHAAASLADHREGFDQ